jgi:CheY-like chemotaxis protein
MRILIAEDHPDNREMLTRRLERRGYEVHQPKTALRLSRWRRAAR